MSIRKNVIARVPLVLAFVIILSSLAIISPFAYLWASDITSAEWRTKVVVSNDGTAAADVSTNFTLSTSEMITARMLNSAATDAAITMAGGTDVPFMPSVNASYPWCVFVHDIDASSMQYLYLYSGNVTGGKISYFPGPGGMTIPHDASMLPASNSTIEMSGWFDTSAAMVGENITTKVDCSVGGNKLLISAAENITYRIQTPGAGAAHSIYMLPDAAGDYTNIDTCLPSTGEQHWEDVDDPVGEHDEIATCVLQVATATKKDAYNLAAPTWAGECPYTITTVTVYYRVYENVDNAAPKARPLLRLGANETIGTQIDLTNAWVTYNEALARPGGGAWTTADFDDLQVVIELTSVMGVSTAECTQIYVKVDYTGSVCTDITAPNISSGEYDILAQTNTYFQGIGVDVPSGAGLPDGAGLVFNAPLYQTALDTSPFTSKDASGHTCTVTGATWGTTGRTFDGDDYITVTDTGSLDALSSNLSIEFWLNRDANSGIGAVYSKDGYTLYVVLEASGASGTSHARLIIESINYDDYVLRPVNWIDIGAWGHYVLTYDGTTAKCYKNGVAGTTNVDAGKSAVTTGATNKIGVYSGGGAHFLEASLGELRIYNRVLTLSEISNNYNATLWRYSGCDEPTYYNYEYVNTAVPNNTADITVGDDDVTPYIEEFALSVNGTPTCNIVWEYDTIFHDTSGYGNDAIPTFRTASSDADVSASISDQTSLVTTANPSPASLGGWTMITEVPDEPTGIYDEGGTSFPGGAEIKKTAGSMRLPKEVFLFPLAFGTAILLGAVAFGLTHRQKMGIKGSLLIMCSVIEGTLIIWYVIGGGVIPGWILIPFGIVAVLLLLWKNPYNPTA